MEILFQTDLQVHFSPLELLALPLSGFGEIVPISHIFPSETKSWDRTGNGNPYFRSYSPRNNRRSPDYEEEEERNNRRRLCLDFIQSLLRFTGGINKDVDLVRSNGFFMDFDSCRLERG